MITSTARALITDALMELNVMGGGETLSATDAEFCAGRLNQIIDQWNGQSEAVFAESFDTFTFVPNLQTYTLGPSAADFAMTNRPVRIDGANVILNNVTPDVRTPIAVVDYDWWLAQQVRSITTTYPLVVYYAPDWPNGTLHFWPKPTTAYGLELMTWGSLDQVTITSNLSMPQGYNRALMLTLAEDVATPYGRPLPPETRRKATEARSIIFGNNTTPVGISTQDAGMPKARQTRASFNYRTGQNMPQTR